jgi:protocatechuate 3,4-dioxygenase beta subunit
VNRIATGRRAGGIYPPYLFEGYRSTIRRAPSRSLLVAPSIDSELGGPGAALAELWGPDDDLTRNSPTGGGEALGERIIVTGHVLDVHGEPVARTLVEVWQANAAGRYVHDKDGHDAPLDPNFTGIGRCVTDDEGRYRLTTIKPGAYPWANHENAWRPAHIHFSVFGHTFAGRLVTQMYFPGDPLHEQDPIFNSIPDEEARARLVADYAHDVTREGWALGYRFNIVLGGHAGTPRDPDDSP